MKAFVLSLALLAAGSLPAFAQFNLTTVGQTYAQNFDSLTTVTTPASAWANDSTLAGWSLFDKNSAAITTYFGGTGSGATGSFYSFGLNSDRALGGLGSNGAYFGAPAPGAVAGYIALALKNTTGVKLTSADIKFNGEQWRNGGNANLAAQSMVLQYGFGGTFGTVSSWNTPGGAFNWASPVVVATAGAVDGNAAGLVANVGGTLSGLTWNNADTLWFRWIENNDAGNDHGLAVDNLTVTVIPEPSTYALLLGATTSVSVFFLRRRKAAQI